MFGSKPRYGGACTEGTLLKGRPHTASRKEKSEAVQLANDKAKKDILGAPSSDFKKGGRGEAAGAAFSAGRAGRASCRSMKLSGGACVGGGVETTTTQIQGRGGEHARIEKTGLAVGF